MRAIDASGPTEAISAALAECEQGEVTNLLLTFPMSISASESLPLSPYVEIARRWQAPQRHESLFFNHGEYMHAAGDPLAYLTDELRSKPTSNRALISLVNGNQIISSGDGALPSFMLVQAGFSPSDHETLCLTAYYRALEVTAFLPINIAELALLAEGIAGAIASISRVQVTIHAFRAHAKHGSTALTKSEIDALAPDELRGLVESRQFQRIADLLREKSAPASIIDDSGLATLSLEAAAAGWSQEFRTEVDDAIVALRKLASLRKVATHGDRVAEMERTVAGHTNRAADIVTRE